MPRRRSANKTATPSHPEARVAVADEKGARELAVGLEDFAEAAKKLINGPLTMRALVVLIQDSVGNGVTKGDIEAVLKAAANLNREYVKW